MSDIVQEGRNSQRSPEWMNVYQAESETMLICFTAKSYISISCLIFYVDRYYSHGQDRLGREAYMGTETLWAKGLTDVMEVVQSGLICLEGLSSLFWYRLNGYSWIDMARTDVSKLDQYGIEKLEDFRICFEMEFKS